MRDPLPKMVPVERLKQKCKVCGRNHFCLVCPTGTRAICTQVESAKKCGEAGWLHRLDEPIAPFTPEYKEPVKRSNWYLPAVKYAGQLDQADRSKLALSLGLPADGLNCLPLIGLLGYEDGKPVYTFPEQDGGGNTIGINRRFPDGTKKHMPGGGRGITLPNGWDDDLRTTIYAVEGPTDTAAMVAAGLTAIGRPSNVGGVAFLTEALRRATSNTRSICVVGENDKKEDGLWPGLVGAISVAGGLNDGLSHNVQWTLAPPEYKDVREYLTSERFEGIDWPDRGGHLEEHLIRQAHRASHCPTGYQSAVNEAKKTVDFNPDKWQY